MIGWIANGIIPKRVARAERCVGWKGNDVCAASVKSGCCGRGGLSHVNRQWHGRENTNDQLDCVFGNKNRVGLQCIGLGLLVFDEIKVVIGGIVIRSFVPLLR